VFCFEQVALILGPNIVLTAWPYVPTLHEQGIPHDGSPTEVAQPEPLPSTSEPSDVLKLQRTIDSLEQENTWLKVQLVRVVCAR
jgi:hypothetical protein